MCVDDVLDDDDGNTHFDNTLVHCALLATTQINITMPYYTFEFFYVQNIVIQVFLNLYKSGDTNF